MPTTVLKNDKAIDAQHIEYVKLYAPTTSLGNCTSMYQMLPKLRAYWTFTSVDENVSIYDYSGQGRTLSCGSIDID